MAKRTNAIDDSLAAVMETLHELRAIRKAHEERNEEMTGDKLRQTLAKLRGPGKLFTVGAVMDWKQTQQK